MQRYSMFFSLYRTRKRAFHLQTVTVHELKRLMAINTIMSFLYLNYLSRSIITVSIINIPTCQGLLKISIEIQRQLNEAPTLMLDPTSQRTDKWFCRM